VTEPDATMIMIGRVWGAQARFHRPGDISVASGSPTSEHPLDDAGVEEVLGAEDLPGADLGVVGAATPRMLGAERPSPEHDRSFRGAVPVPDACRGRDPGALFPDAFGQLGLHHLGHDNDPGRLGDLHNSYLLLHGGPLSVGVLVDARSLPAGRTQAGDYRLTSTLFGTSSSSTMDTPPMTGHGICPGFCQRTVKVGTLRVNSFPTDRVVTTPSCAPCRRRRRAQCRRRDSEPQAAHIRTGPWTQVPKFQPLPPS